MKLQHNHVVDRNAVAVKMKLAGKLTPSQQEEVSKMTGELAHVEYLPWVRATLFLNMSCGRINGLFAHVSMVLALCCLCTWFP